MSQLILGLSASYEDVSEMPATAVAVRVASRPYRDGADQWLPRIVAGSDPEIRLSISMPWENGRAAASYGAIDLANSDGALDAWMEGIWSGREGELRVGHAYQPWDEWALVAVVRLNHPEYIDGRILRLTFRDRIEDLDRPIQINFFEDAPNEDLNGQRKPIIIGHPFHCPALLWDNVDADEIYYYVADTAEPASPNGVVREGLAPIFKGTGPGQYQDWPNGFRLNSQPTLPLTCFFSGPRNQPWPLNSSRFTDWASVGQLQLPHLWPEIENANLLVGRYASRKAGTDYLEVQLENSTSGWVRIGQGTALEQNKTYRLHWRAVEDQNYDNYLHMEIRAYAAPTGSASSILLYSDRIDFLADEPIQFTWPDLTADYFIRLRFDRVLEQDVFLSALFSAIWVEEVDAAGNTIDQLVPWAVCERGRVVDGLETGPLSYQDVDHPALQAITASLDVMLGHYWQDQTTHRDLLDQLFRSVDACWWFSRAGQLTGERALFSSGPPVLTFDDRNRTVSIEVQRAPAERLTDSFKWQRNYRPVRDGEAAESVNENDKAASARDYRRQDRASAAARSSLHPDYRFADGAEPDVTLIISFTGAANLERADPRIEEHSQRIWLWRVEGVLSVTEQAMLEPKSRIRLISSRLGIQDGIDVEVLDIRLLPVSGRVQLIARG